MMTEEVWVKSAMTDDDLVAELLLRIKHSSHTFVDRIPVPPSTSENLPPVRWGSYKLRSTTVKKEKSEGMGFSPITPLSWSGGGGAAGTSTSDLQDESSRGSDGKSIGRSKGAFCIDNASISATDKKSRKRMACSELKEEEMLQMNHVKKELATLQPTVDEQNAENQNLKRMKMTDDSSTKDENKKPVRKFLIPDLNMIPEEDMDLECSR